MSLLREITLMKTLTTLITILFISLLSSPSWSETVSMDDLVERDDLFYKKFNNVPFTGEVSGLENGKFKKGKKEGEWLSYNDNGQLTKTGIYIDGKEDGLWEKYWDNGQISTRITYIDGGYETVFKHYYDNGKIEFQGQSKDGKQEGAWVWYSKNGQIDIQGNYKEGKKHGDWLSAINGVILTTSTYKDGKVLEVQKSSETVLSVSTKKIEGEYVCEELSNHTNSEVKTSFREQRADDKIIMNIYEDKVVLNVPRPGSLSEYDRTTYDFRRHSENVGRLDLEAFNLEGAYRNIMFLGNDLTFVVISTPHVWVSNYTCAQNF